jgi:glutamate synthase domain-containing protein 2
MRQLPPLCFDLSRGSFENRQNKRYIKRKRELVKRAITEIYRQAEAAAFCFLPWKPETIPDLLGSYADQRIPGDKPIHRSLREPMECKITLGKKPNKIERDANGKLINNMPPQMHLNVPIMFSAMSYGSISYNAHESLARAATELGIYYNTGEGGLHEDFYKYGKNTIVQVASGRFGVHKDYLNAGAAIEIKMGQGAKPGIGGHLPGKKSWQISPEPV